MKIDIDLAAFFVRLYNKNKRSKEVLGFLVDSEVPKKVLLWAYNDFLSQEVFIPIELLLTDVKMILVDKCRETGLNFNNDRLTDAARILYTINFINENS